MAKAEWKDADGTVSNIMLVSALGKGTNLYAITFTYKVDGHYFGGEFKAPTGHGYAVGDRIAVLYNPAKPEENDLNGRGEWGTWIHVAYCGVIVAAVIYFCFHGCD